jgi:hypothetical protein
MRLADEYDSAQERGEVARQGQRTDLIPDCKKVPSPQEVGLSGKDIHEARKLRDAERDDPGLISRALDDMVSRGEEPTRAALKCGWPMNTPRRRSGGRLRGTAEVRLSLTTLLQPQTLAFAGMKFTRRGKWATRFPRQLTCEICLQIAYMLNPTPCRVILNFHLSV